MFDVLRVCSIRFIATVCYGCSLVIVSGCAVPGFSLLDQANVSVGQKQHILGYRPVVEDPPSALEGDLAGLVTPISPALVRSQIDEKNKGVPIDVRQLVGTAPSYTIGPGDVVGIVIYDHPELLPNAGAVITQATDPTGVNVAPGFIVGAGGEISFPYIGRVRIEGLTEMDATDLITKKIASYIKDPQVTVRIQSFRSRRAYVEGEVKSPGMQIFTDIPMTLAEALNRAGGITSVGDRSFITLSRAGKTISLNLPYLQENGVDSTSIPLLNGDIVNVRNREDSKVYVMGEALRPSALLMRNGKLSLNEALGEAGGPNLATANPGQIYVIRNRPEGGANVFQLDAKNPVSLALADRFALQPRDVVYIDPVPLVQWSRLVNLILPAASVVNYGSQVITR